MHAWRQGGNTYRRGRLSLQSPHSLHVLVAQLLCLCHVLLIQCRGQVSVRRVVALLACHGKLVAMQLQHGLQHRDGDVVLVDHASVGARFGENKSAVHQIPTTWDHHRHPTIRAGVVDNVRQDGAVGTVSESAQQAVVPVFAPTRRYAPLPNATGAIQQLECRQILAAETGQVYLWLRSTFVALATLNTVCCLGGRLASLRARPQRLEL